MTQYSTTAAAASEGSLVASTLAELIGPDGLKARLVPGVAPHVVTTRLGQRILMVDPLAVTRAADAGLVRWDRERWFIERAD